ncbi:UBX domain-containing protein 1 [Elsinoe australis]|uniref:UBX domain-containing protein 1 n=1 Tax=Elsinoe australis TaxID=40998 RepID=A0A4U7B287_9PEZI|nr:UBX domain-containing protein 1 [Elsinoe australis]
MFYEGDLQSGIALAVKENKLVACLVVKENDPESSRWEKEWFGTKSEDHSTATPAGGDPDDATHSFGELLSVKAIILRLFEGSDEVGFLSAFCAIDNVPKLVIISDGTLIVDVASNSTEEELAKVAPKLIEILSTDPSPTPASNQAQDTQAATADSAEQRVSLPLLQRVHQPALTEEEKQEAEREARKAISSARRLQAERSAAGEDVTAPWKRTWVEHQRVRQREAQVEREAIRRTIAEDRERRQQRRKVSPTTSASSSNTTKMASSSALSLSNSCSLHIRLFDGTSIRTKFSADSTVSTAVRTFVTENSSTDVPYNFRIMDLPKPARTIEISEENQTLRELGLCPNATLVLVPVRDFTDAYLAQGPAGVLRKGMNLGYNVAYGAFSVVGGIFSKVTGYPVDPETSEGPYIAGTGDNPDHLVSRKDEKRPATDAAAKPVTKVNTLADQKDKQPAEFYNGNQTNVEPRPDDKK